MIAACYKWPIGCFSCKIRFRLQIQFLFTFPSWKNGTLGYLWNLHTKCSSMTGPKQLYPNCSNLKRLWWIQFFEQDVLQILAMQIFDNKKKTRWSRKLIKSIFIWFSSNWLSLNRKYYERSITVVCKQQNLNYPTNSSLSKLVSFPTQLPHGLDNQGSTVVLSHLYAKKNKCISRVLIQPLYIYKHMKIIL